MIKLDICFIKFVIFVCATEYYIFIKFFRIFVSYYIREICVVLIATR